MKGLLKSAIVALSITLSAQCAVYAQTIKREFRSTWISTVWGLDWPKSGTGTSAAKQAQQKAEIDTYLDKMQDANFTSVCFQVRSRADAYYKSKYVPWTSDVSGTRGVSPGWDPLEYMVAQCHARGLECYAWINPYRWSTSSNDWSTATDKQWINDGWILRFTSSDGTILNYLNPGIKAVHDHVINIVDEIVGGYKVDGLIIDDYFYQNGLPKTSAAGDYQLWKNSGTTMTIGDWRRNNVNVLVADIYAKVQEIRPDVRFGIGPPGTIGASASQYGLPSTQSYGIKATDWQYDGQFTDPLQWLFAGTVDFVSPQIYWKTTHSTAPFGPLTNWWSNAAAKAGRHHYASHSISGFSSDNTSENWSETCLQISLSRQYTQNNAPGFCLFRTAFISGPITTGFGNYLKQTMTPHKSLQPEITWNSERFHNYAAVTHAAQNGEQLTWDAVTDGNRIIKYTIYAVPNSMKYEDVVRSDGDGIASDYLLGVSYTNSYTLPTQYSSGFWYAICVYDGFSREHTPAFVGLKVTENAPATSLISPANGSTVSESVNFEWEAVDCDTYTIQLSKDADFTTIYREALGVTNNSYVLDAARLSRGRYYWRVLTNKSECLSTESEVWSFVVEKSSVGDYEEGYSVQNDGVRYASSGDIQFTNLWIRSITDDFRNFSVEGVGSLNRGFTVRQDGIWVSGRSANSSNANLYLDHYDRATGEHIERVSLNGGQCSYFPCNDVIKDAADNLIITNLSLNISTTPIKMFKVNVLNGNVWNHVDLTYSGGGRVDHVAIVGDVTSNHFVVFAAVASSKTIIRWTVDNQKLTKTETCTLSNLHPQTAEHLGIAPVVIPVNENEFYVNGSETTLMRYEFVANATVEPTGSFAHSLSSSYQRRLHSSDIPVKSPNGGTFFSYAGKSYIVAPFDGHDGASGYNWAVYATDAEYSYSNMSHQWYIPAHGIGQVDNTVAQARAASIVDNDVATIYVYAPGNGLAAYNMMSSDPTGVFTIKTEGFGINVAGSRVMLNREVDEVMVYNLAGSKLIDAHNVSQLDCSGLAKGFYLVTARCGSRTMTKKVAIR